MTSSRIQNWLFHRTGSGPLFDVYSLSFFNASKDGKYYLFPSGFQRQIANARTKRERARVVADCVSGMTEKEILHIHRSLQGLH